MKRSQKAKIFFNVLPTHPDIEYIEDINKELSFEDTYIYDNDRFDNADHKFEYIKHDLMLIASGGYSCEHITNVRFEFN